MALKVKILKKIAYNWHIKLLSILCAAIIWIYVDSIKEKEKFLSIPLQIKDVPRNYMVSNDIPRFTKVVFKGKEDSLSLLDGSVIKAFIDCENSVGPEIKKVVRIDKKSIPSGISIKNIDPGIITIKLEKVKRKIVNVIPVIIGEPPDGYNFEDVLVDPKNVEIEGPESMLNTIDSVYTSEIDIGKLKTTTISEIEIKSEEKKFSLISNKKVSARIIIKEQYIIKRIPSAHISIQNLKDGLKPDLEVENVNISIRLPKRIENNFSLDKILVFIDLSAIDKPGSYTIPVLFETSVSNITLIKIEPETINLKLVSIP